MRRSDPFRAVVQFAVTGTCALLLLGFLAVTLLRNTGKSEAIRDARQTTRLAGEGVVAPAITPALLTQRDAPQTDGPDLTARENEILALLAKGLPNKRIALDLGISEKTVKAHVTSI